MLAGMLTGALVVGGALGAAAVGVVVSRIKRRRRLEFTRRWRRMMLTLGADLAPAGCERGVLGQAMVPEASVVRDDRVVYLGVRRSYTEAQGWHEFVYVDAPFPRSLKLGCSIGDRKRLFYGKDDVTCAIDHPTRPGEPFYAYARDATQLEALLTETVRDALHSGRYHTVINDSWARIECPGTEVLEAELTDWLEKAEALRDVVWHASRQLPAPAEADQVSESWHSVAARHGLRHDPRALRMARPPRDGGTLCVELELEQIPFEVPRWRDLAWRTVVELRFDPPISSPRLAPSILSELEHLADHVAVTEHVIQAIAHGLLIDEQRLSRLVELVDLAGRAALDEARGPQLGAYR